MNPADAVTILARTSEDWIPSPRLPEPTAAVVKARPANSDPDSHAATELVPCGTCGGRGRLLGPRPCHACPVMTKPGKERPPGWAAMRKRRAQHGCLPCPGCESGWRERREGETPVDSYTLERLPLDDEARVERPVDEQLRSGELRYSEPWELEAAIRKTERVLALMEGRVDLEQFGWERVKQLYWRQGDYALLSWAQHRLGAERPMRLSTWNRFVVGRDEPVTSDRMSGRILETSQLLAAWMISKRRQQLNGLTTRRPRAVEIRVPPWLLPSVDAEARKPSLWRGRSGEHVAQRANRDALIVAMADRPTVELATRFSLSEKRIRQIIDQGLLGAATGPAA